MSHIDLLKNIKQFVYVQAKALGQIGIDRCVEYTKQKRGDLSPHEFYTLVFEHWEEKLSKLSSEHMRTSFGKELVKPLEQEMVHCLEEMKTKC
jgi:uncharacterized protein (DUF1015 family)